MTELDKIAYVKVLLGDTDDTSDDVISAYLRKAKMAILNRRFIVIPDKAEVPQKYHILQCELAQRYINRQGAEGETVHNENGINRSYDSANDEDLLSAVLPVAVM